MLSINGPLAYTLSIVHLVIIYFVVKTVKILSFYFLLIYIVNAAKFMSQNSKVT